MAAVKVETWPVETSLFIADRRIPELEWYTRRLIGSNARQVAAETQHEKEEANGIGDPAQGLTVEGLSFERKRYKLASIYCLQLQYIHHGLHGKQRNPVCLLVSLAGHGGCWFQDPTGTDARVPYTEWHYSRHSVTCAYPLCFSPSRDV